MPLMPLTVPEDIEPYFFNRKRELKQLNSFLNILKDKVEQDLLITGPRGIGKTFLLKKLIQEFPSDLMVSYVDINRIYGKYRQHLSSQDLMKEILKIMIKDLRSQRRSLSEELDNNVAMIHNKLKRNDYEFDLVSALLEMDRDEEDHLSSFVVQLPSKVVENSFFTNYVLILDNFQLLDEDILFKFLSNHNRVNYILSGPLPLKSSLIDKIASPTRLMHVPVRPFSREDLGIYLKDMVASLRFTREGMDYFFEFTGGNPAYINSTINTLGHNVMYGERTMREIFKFKLEQIAVMWLGIWTTLSSQEREIIIKLVDSGPMRWTEVLNKVDFSRGTLNKYMELLINKGIVLKSGQLYGVEDSMLRAWLKYKKEVDGFYPW